MWKTLLKGRGLRFSFQLHDIAQKGMLFGGPKNVVGLQQLSTMKFTATDILHKRCFTVSGYNVLM